MIGSEKGSESDVFQRVSQCVFWTFFAKLLKDWFRKLCFSARFAMCFFAKLLIDLFRKVQKVVFFSAFRSVFFRNAIREELVQKKFRKVCLRGRKVRFCEQRSWPRRAATSAERSDLIRQSHPRDNFIKKRPDMSRTRSDPPSGTQLKKTGMG